MKQSLKIGLAVLMLHNNPIHALNPINGWYAGIILGGSYAPNANLTFNLPNTPNSGSCSLSATCSTNTTGSFSYSGYGNIGGQIGFRSNHFRAELEPVVNYNPYQNITVNGVTYTSPNQSAGLRLKGDTTTVGVMLNGFYDFYTPGGASNFVPYLGAGVGYAYIQNTIKFYCNNQLISCTSLSSNTNSPIGQGIVGAAYYLDDFTWFGLDYRYITTKELNNILDSRVQVHTINLSFNGVFNCL
ncbi:outer membrane protein [Legionella nagasakiensis]|uniref:outer membrane protein n=1 Tax=Legionella nagasakiensis TaxID=535290 RepID=UPI0010557EA0|nr:outer membrane beta-barrel protein [Legionella nagasakiensis]